MGAYQDERDDDHFEDRPKKKLGSLAQNARSKQLTSARAILIFVGLVTAGANIYFALQAEEVVRAQIDKELASVGGRGNVPAEKRAELKKIEDQAIQTTKLAGGIFTLVGVLFIIGGICIKMYPVPITIMALVLYIAGNAISAVFDPEMIAKGLILKIIIIVALAKSIQAAIAFEDERKKASREQRYRDEGELEEEPA